MSSGLPKRTRQDRVATVKLPPGLIHTTWETLRRGHVLAKLGLCLLAAVTLWVLTGGWLPPLGFREGDVPPRNVVARVTFERKDEQATREARHAARQVLDAVYRHDPRPLVERQQALKDQIFNLLSVESAERVDPSVWSRFALPEDSPLRRAAPRPAQPPAVERPTAEPSPVEDRATSRASEAATLPQVPSPTPQVSAEPAGTGSPASTTSPTESDATDVSQEPSTRLDSSQEKASEAAPPQAATDKAAPSPTLATSTSPTATSTAPSVPPQVVLGVRAADVGATPADDTAGTPTPTTRQSEATVASPRLSPDPQTAGGSATEAAIAAPADASPSLNASPAVAGVVPPQPAAAQADTARTARLSEIEQFRAYFQDDPGLSRFTAALKRALAEVESHGLLDSLEHPMTEGNHTRVRVYPVGNPEFLRSYDVDQVRIGQVLPQLRQYLHRELGSPVVAERIFYWLQGNLPTTLSYDSNLTHQLGEQEVRNIPPVTIRYMAGQTVLAPAGERISAATLAVLQDEHREFVNQLGPAKLIAFSLSKFGMYIAMYLLCGFYILFRQPALLDSTAKIGKMLGLAVLAVAVSWFAAESWFELIPMLMFAMTVSIVYQQELALLLTVAVALVAVLSLGLGVVELVTILSATASAILLLRHVRTRTKLIWVALWSAFVTMATAIGVGTLSVSEPASVLLVNAAWLGGCAVASGLLMTGLLPFVERFYGVQTDLSLLELGDVAHPLLQELVRRAPGTYNHSINVASIGQAAAEAVGANGLLVRVGAYFHDIGKMLKPGYFVENQSGEGNCHESLVPAMSTLVIIAHVKDGAGLAREHNLPQPLIDFIEQHHGTTLVEYFYRRANEQQKEADGRSEVDEGTYRYPGPKPQTREAAVLMLADGVESAARTLVDPAPSRIENLVEKIAMNKLMDGQFDECGLTLKELRMIQDSLVKSLTAVYHGRIKYPDQQTA